MKKLFYSIAFACVVVACNNPSNQNTETNAEEPVTENVSTESTVANGLYGSNWELTELSGTAITLDETFPQKPHIIFHEDNKVVGNGGCNGMGGNVELKDNNGIVISDIAATQMACPNLEVETQFIEALRATQHYQIDGDILTLSKGDNEVLAKLVKNSAE